MLDAMTALAAPPATIRREDYREPDWLVPELELDFQLDPARTLVTARLTVKRNGAHDRPLKLDAEALDLKSVTVDGRPVQHSLDGEVLTVPISSDSALVETIVEIAPEKNSQLMGLYASGGILCTQCEAEGFPADHALSRPPGRAQPLPRAPDGGQGTLSGAAVQRRSDRQRRSRRRTPLGAVG
jgi:aminopeptidase N